MLAGTLIAIAAWLAVGLALLGVSWVGMVLVAGGEAAAGLTARGKPANGSVFARHSHHDEAGPTA